MSATYYDGTAVNLGDILVNAPNKGANPSLEIIGKVKSINNAAPQGFANIQIDCWKARNISDGGISDFDDYLTTAGPQAVNSQLCKLLVSALKPTTLG